MRSERVLATSIRTVVAMVVVAALSSCSNLDPVGTYQQVTDPAQLYASLTIETRAVNLSTMAPYDTFRLSAVPRDALGRPMDGLPTATFSLMDINDTARATITPDGLIQAHSATEFYTVNVIAELKVPGNVVHLDTAAIWIIDGPPPQVSSLTYNAIAPDSTNQGTFVSFNEVAIDWQLITELFVRNIFNSSSPAAPRALNAQGQPVGGILVEYNSLDRTVATEHEFVNTTDGSNLYDQGKPRIYGIRAGQVGIAATAMVFGTLMADTFPLAVTWPVMQFVKVVPGVNGAPPTFFPAEARIAPSALVFFRNTTDDTVDVTWDNPDNVVRPPSFVCDTIVAYPGSYGDGPGCGTGHMVMPPVPRNSANTPQPLQTTRARQIVVPGVYTYHSTRTGATGRLIVTADTNPVALP